MKPPAPEEAVTFLTRWRSVRQRTFALAGEIRPELREMSGGSDGRTVRELFAHQIASQDAILRGLTSGSFRFDEASAKAAELDWNGLCDAARRLDDELEVLLEGCSSHWWGEIAGHGLSRGEWLWQMLEHEIHHRAQIPLIIRLNGGDPPRVYD